MNPFSHLAFSPWVQKLGYALLHSLWQGALIAALLALVLRLLRQGSANARYLAACMALVALGICPVVTLIALPNAPAPLVQHTQIASPEMAAGGTVSASFPTAAMPSGLPRVTISLASDGAARPPASWGPAWLLPGLVMTWLLGVLCLSLRLLGNWLHVQWLTRAHWRPIGKHLQERAEQLARRMGITRPVRVVESARIPVPLVVGWLQATVLFPASALTGLSPRQLEAILAHELAHIRRQDYLVNALQMILETLLFYHPATWWISEHIRNERENCCDDLAIQLCGDRMMYARALAALEDLRDAPVSLAMAADGGHLLSRIRRILGKPSRTRFSPLHTGGSAMLCLVSFAFLAWLTPALVHASDKTSSKKAARHQASLLPSVAPVAPLGLPPATSSPSALVGPTLPRSVAPTAPAAALAGVTNPADPFASRPAAAPPSALAGPTTSKRRKKQRRSAPLTGIINPVDPFTAPSSGLPPAAPVAHQGTPPSALPGPATARPAERHAPQGSAALPVPPLALPPGGPPPGAPDTPQGAASPASPGTPPAQPGESSGPAAPHEGTTNSLAAPIEGSSTARISFIASGSAGTAAAHRATGPDTVPRGAWDKTGYYPDSASGMAGNENFRQGSSYTIAPRPAGQHGIAYETVVRTPEWRTALAGSATETIKPVEGDAAIIVRDFKPSQNPATTRQPGSAFTTKQNAALFSARLGPQWKLVDLSDGVLKVVEQRKEPAHFLGKYRDASHIVTGAAPAPKQ